VINSHRFSHHIYADDSHIYISLSTVVNIIKNNHPIPLHSQYVTSAVSARRLRVTFDNHFNFTEHITFVERIIIIFVLYGIWLFLLQNILQLALLASKPDYYNSISLQNIALKDIIKSWCIQSCLARDVSGFYILLIMCHF